MDYAKSRNLSRINDYTRGEKVRWLRENMAICENGHYTGCSMDVLAKKLSISKSTLSSVENDGDCKLDTIYTIADYFDISIDWLCSRSKAGDTNYDLNFVCEYTGLNENLIKEMSTAHFPHSIIRFLNMYCHDDQKWKFEAFCASFEVYKFLLQEYNTEAKNILSKDPHSISEKDIEKLDKLNDDVDLFEYKTELRYRELIQKYAAKEISERESLKTKHSAISSQIYYQIMNDCIDKARGESHGNNQETE